MSLKQYNEEGSLDRVQGTPLSEGRKKYERKQDDIMKLNEYVKGWKDMDTYIRMAVLYQKATSKGVAK